MVLDKGNVKASDIAEFTSRTVKNIREDRLKAEDTPECRKRSKNSKSQNKKPFDFTTYCNAVFNTSKA